MLNSKHVEDSTIADADERVFEIDGENFDDFAGFVREFNRGFVSRVGGVWHGNVDAFHDYLNWVDDRYVLRWLNSEQSRQNLGHAAMAVGLSENLKRCHPSNRASVQQRLNRARNESGPTLFDWLVEIIEDNKDCVDLKLE